MTQDVNNLRNAIAHAEQEVFNGQQLLELQKNTLFQDIIIEGYIRNHIDHLMDQLALASSPEAVASTQRRMDGVAMFRGWLNEILKNAYRAESILPELRQELENALEEQREDVQ